MIVSHGIVFLQKRLAGIFFAHQPKLNFIAISECVFHRSIKILSPVFPIGITLKNAVGKLSVSCPALKGLVEPGLNFVSPPTEHFLHRWLFFLRFAREKKRQDQFYSFKIEKRDIPEFKYRVDRPVLIQKFGYVSRLFKIDQWKLLQLFAGNPV
ncbi:hypothetical protein SDC9_156840 [bioreactor metagenome]|uniref:Uncharacterized protein n=1 Tax=bioreactor metagenome TaxID=1076179 RepID=A0A645F888_9ZZZZ